MREFTSRTAINQRNSFFNLEQLKRLDNPVLQAYVQTEYLKMEEVMLLLPEETSEVLLERLAAIAMGHPGVLMTVEPSRKIWLGR